MVTPTIVLHGSTSAGKSTLARALQDGALAPAFHVTLDAVVTMSRRSDMRTSKEQLQAYPVHCENLRSTLARLTKTPFEIILDFVLRDESELQACFRVLSVRPHAPFRGDRYSPWHEATRQQIVIHAIDLNWDGVADLGVIEWLESGPISNLPRSQRLEFVNIAGRWWFTGSESYGECT